MFLARVAAPGSQAGLCAPPGQPGACHSLQPCLQALGPGSAESLPRSFPAVTWERVGRRVKQGGWELERGLAALMLSHGGRKHGPTSSSCLYLPVSLAATFT